MPGILKQSFCETFHASPGFHFERGHVVGQKVGRQWNLLLLAVAVIGNSGQKLRLLLVPFDANDFDGRNSCPRLLRLSRFLRG